ncbi:MAG: hypothetical protein HZB56_07900 [Deltaproteobacteria bacterium]|nr:hypothetical protein [Deltaproteobacteria bacterium]
MDLLAWWKTLKEVVVVAGVVLGAGSLYFAARTYWRNGLIEEDRWRSHLALQAVAMDSSVAISEAVHAGDSMTVEVLRPRPPATTGQRAPSRPPAKTPATSKKEPSGNATVALTPIAAAGSVGREAAPQEKHRPSGSAAAREAPPAGTTFAIESVTATGSVAGVASSRETIHVIVRNASFRPAAIVCVFLRDHAGRPVGPDWWKNVGRLHLPLPIPPWQIATLAIDVDGTDFEQAVELVVGDGDDGEVAIPLRERARWREWIDFQRPPSASKCMHQ